jgi:hypothetical protein
MKFPFSIFLKKWRAFRGIYFNKVGQFGCEKVFGGRHEKFLDFWSSVKRFFVPSIQGCAVISSFMKVFHQ